VQQHAVAIDENVLLPLMSVEFRHAAAEV
jgi:hypothetical protein